MQGKIFESLALYKRLLEINPNDWEACFQVAIMFESYDQSLALQFYEKGLQKCQAVPPEVLNNVGVLRLEAFEQQGDKQLKSSSLLALQQALRETDEKLHRQRTSKMEALRTSILFNLGYWHEINFQLDQANALYKQVIHEQPDYFDAYLRASCLARGRGDMPRALHWIEESLKCKLKSPYNQLC